jgi:hypothetical protein
MLGTILRLLSAFLGGDLIWFALGGAVAILFSSAALPIRNPWIRAFAYICLGVIGILVAHWAYELFQAWYTAPLGPPLQIDMGPQT